MIKKILKTIFDHNIVNWNYWKGCNCYIHNSVFKVYKLNKLMDLLFGYQLINLDDFVIVLVKIKKKFILNFVNI